MKQIITPEEVLAIDAAIHSKEDTVEVGGMALDIKRSLSNHCRYTSYKGYLFMEQNTKPNKTTEWADMARAGTPITWGMRNSYEIRVVNHKIEMLK